MFKFASRSLIAVKITKRSQERESFFGADFLFVLEALKAPPEI